MPSSKTSPTISPLDRILVGALKPPGTRSVREEISALFAATSDLGLLAPPRTMLLDLSSSFLIPRLLLLGLTSWGWPEISGPYLTFFLSSLGSRGRGGGGGGDNSQPTALPALDPNSLLSLLPARPPLLHCLLFGHFSWSCFWNTFSLRAYLERACPSFQVQLKCYLLWKPSLTLEGSPSPGLPL